MPLHLGKGSACDVCWEEFSVTVFPTSLPCGHVFCSGCLGDINSSATLENLCPYCRQPFTRAAARLIRFDVDGADAVEAAASPQIPSGAQGVDALRFGRGGANDAEEGRYVAHEANCDVCTLSIRGPRYKCQQCPDWDACEQCFPVMPIHHPHHAFVAIRRLNDYQPPLLVNPPQSHPANCNNCGRNIRGSRFKCTHQNCPDFDLCEICEALPVPVHPRSHALLKLYATPPPLAQNPRILADRLQLVPPIANAGLNRGAPAGRVRHHAWCDVCGETVLGVRYKCTHPGCMDFDLCEACEANPAIGQHHPSEHPLIKIRVPLHDLPPEMLPAALPNFGDPDIMHRHRHGQIMERNMQMRNNGRRNEHAGLAYLVPR